MNGKDRRRQPSQDPEAGAWEPGPTRPEGSADEGPETTGGTTGGHDVPIESPESSPDSSAEPTEADRVQELEDRIKRLQAGFLNDSRRIQRQADESRKFAVEGLVADLLPVFDALHSARQGLAAAGETSDAVREGLDLVERELLNVLGRHGVERIEALGCAFDPNQHEALYVVPDHEQEPNMVVEVLRPGFALNGRVVRPAHVAVTGASAAESQ